MPIYKSFPTIRVQINQYFRRCNLPQKVTAAKIGVAYRRAVKAIKAYSPEIYNSSQDLCNELTIAQAFEWAKSGLGRNYWVRFDIPVWALDRDLKDQVAKYHEGKSFPTTKIPPKKD